MLMPFGSLGTSLNYRCSLLCNKIFLFAPKKFSHNFVFLLHTMIFFSCFFIYFIFIFIFLSQSFFWVFFCLEQESIQGFLVNSNLLSLVKIDFELLFQLLIQLHFVHLKKLKMYCSNNHLARIHKTSYVNFKIGQKQRSWCAFSNIFNPQHVFHFHKI